MTNTNCEYGFKTSVIVPVEIVGVTIVVNPLSASVSRAAGTRAKLSYFV
jgi:hypothetical protein